MKATGLRRKPTDKFYTSAKVAQRCVEAARPHVSLPGAIIVEPSAGGGAFIPYVRGLADTCMFYDLEPEHPEVIKQDFLDLQLDMPDGTHLCFVGNPPFGRQSSLAIKFIKKCSIAGNVIAFILPSSFKKDSMKRHFPPRFHLVHEHDIERNAFTADGTPCDVPCVFQVWVKTDHDRAVPAKLTPAGFSFVGKHDAPDLAFRRVGVYAGRVYMDIADRAEQSHYFLKLDDADNLEAKTALLNSLSFAVGNTVGPRSISKQELIAEYSKAI